MRSNRIEREGENMGENMVGHGSKLQTDGTHPSAFRSLARTMPDDGGEKEFTDRGGGEDSY